MNNPSIAILDFGSQYTQLIARRVREAKVYCEIFAWDTPREKVLALQPRAFILSGGPNSVYDPGAPTLPAYVIDSGLPILGICYGMMLLADQLGGQVTAAQQREYGPANIEITDADSALFAQSEIETLKSKIQVWMSHGDRIDAVPNGFHIIAQSDNSPIAAMADPQRKFYGIQFHPEVKHTPQGQAIIRNFLFEVAGCQPTWTSASFIEESIANIKARVGREQVVCGLSGGVDSSVAAALIHRAVDDQLTCVFIDTGMLRQGEPEQVVETFQKSIGLRLIAVNAVEEFLSALDSVVDPEQKRKIIG